MEGRRMSRFSEDFDNATTYAVAPRNRAFQAGREPMRHRSDLRLVGHRIRGPFGWLNPTRAHYSIVDEREKQCAQASPGVSFKWTSRNNRKGRHALRIDEARARRTPGGAAPTQLPKETARPSQLLRGIGRMFTHFPVWDISYLVAVIFTLGSVVWVINAFFVFLPLIRPSSEFPDEVLYGGGITAFIGATIFEIGSFFLVAEAVNENRTGCFGWALEHVLSSEPRPPQAESDGQADEQADEEKAGESSVRLRPSLSACEHHHTNRSNLIGRSNYHGATSTTPDYSSSSNGKSWTWLPSYYNLRNHYSHELGFLASITQLLAASIFWITGFTSLPGIYDHLSMPLLDGIYWTPQIVGGSGFILSGLLFMLEMQPKWWKPAPKTLGWHIGLWNLIGGLGFTLCPAFGYDRSSWAQYQACCSTFWGSWAFLIGSVIQWYESLDKHPVEVGKTDGY